MKPEPNEASWPKPKQQDLGERERNRDTVRHHYFNDTDSQPVNEIIAILSHNGAVNKGSTKQNFSTFSC